MIYCLIALAVVFTVVMQSIYFNHELRTSVSKKSTNSTADLTSDSIDNDKPKDAYYFLCGESKEFEFRNYLSVRSVFQHLTPYRVRLFYENEPIAREQTYNTWLTDLRRDYAFFSIEKLPENWCHTKRRNIDEYLSENGGIYVREDIILGGPLDDWFSGSSGTVRVLERSTNETLIQTSRGRQKSIFRNAMRKHRRTVSVANSSIKFISGGARLENNHYDTGKVRIISKLARPLNESTRVGEHTVLLFKAVVPVFPEDIWELDSEAGRLLRTAAYGSPEIVRPTQDFNHLAPNIAHVIWSNDDAMSFHFYLCILSLLELAKMDEVFIHGNGPPTGMYWDLVKDHPKLRLVYRTLIGGEQERVYGTEVKDRAHVTDVLRVDIMYRYGGLYVDTDAIFFRPLTREIRSYDAVVSPDISQDGHDFPNIYQNGIMLGKPGAVFWRLFLESMKNYYDDDWIWNSCFTLYKIKERHPETVRCDPRLNTICMDFKCRPFWESNLFHASNEETEKVMKQWQHETFSIHHVIPDLPEYSSHKALLENNGTTFFGEVALYVLEQTGKLDYFKNLK